jgi:cation diffusion facilitator family transporter
MAGCGCGEGIAGDSAAERRVLWLVLALNATMFVVEGVGGWLAESTGLLADALDMLADATVYGIALWAVGRHAGHKLTAARLSGWLQLALGLGVLLDVLRRLAFGSTPEPPMIGIIGLLALAANVACLLLLQRHREGEMHMRASWIFTKNDVIANLAVLAAGGLVAWTGSRLPDLVAGFGIAALVIRGGVNILRETAAVRPPCCPSQPRNPA